MHFSPAQLRAFGDEARARDIEIASLHAPCPVKERWTDGLASTNPTEQASAVDAIRGSIDAAAEVGAHAIVVHLGNTGVFGRQARIFDAIARTGRFSDEHRRLRDEAWAEREARKGPHLAAALQSIRALGEHAVGSGVTIGVECRDGYHEIPSMDEYEDVFAACAGLPVGYWHDAGHGAKLDYAGFLEHEEFLRRYGDRLVGMHVHDTRAGYDHLAPGMGDTDFSMLARYLGPATIRTLELRPTVTAAEISYGLEFLETFEAFGVREGMLIEL